MTENSATSGGNELLLHRGIRTASTDTSAASGRAKSWHPASKKEMETTHTAVPRPVLECVNRCVENR